MVVIGGNLGYLVSMAAELYDNPLDDEALKTEQIGELIQFDFKKTDGTRIQILDNVLRVSDAEKYLQATNLEIIERKDFYADTINVPIYSMYVCR